MSLVIMQGDQYAIPIIGKQNGKPLDMTTVDEVEFVIGKMRKLYPGEVVLDEDGTFLFPLTQQETFAVQRSSQHVQIRVKFKGDPPVVVGVDVGRINVDESVSKEVL